MAEDIFAKYKKPTAVRKPSGGSSLSSDDIFAKYKNPKETPAPVQKTSPAVEQAVAALPAPKEKQGFFPKTTETIGDISEEIPLGVGSAFGSLPSGILSGVQTIKRQLQNKVQNSVAFKVFDHLFPEQAGKVNTAIKGINENKASQTFDTLVAKAKEKTDFLKKQVESGVQAYREGRDITGKVVREEDVMSIPEKGVNALATTVGYMIPAFLAAPAVGAGGASVIGGFIEAGTDSSMVHDDLIAQGKSKKEAEKGADIQFTTSAIVNTLSDRLGIFGDTPNLLKRIINSELSEVPAETLTQLSSNILTGKDWDTGLVETAITTAAITPFLGAMGGNLNPKQKTELENILENKLNENKEFKNLDDAQKQKVIDTLSKAITEPVPEEITPESLDQIANEITQFKQTEPYLKPEAKQDEALFKKAPIETETAPGQEIEAKKYKSAEEFIASQKTGSIQNNPYESTVKSLSESDLYKKDKNPVKEGQIKVDGKTLEIRSSGEDLKYVKKDKDGNIVRDEKGTAVFQSQEEMTKKGLPIKSQDMVVYDGDTPIAYISDSFGSPEVSVAKEYQRKGIGSEILSKWMSKQKPGKKLGQMTKEGEAMVRSIYNKATGKQVDPQFKKKEELELNDEQGKIHAEITGVIDDLANERISKEEASIKINALWNEIKTSLSEEQTAILEKDIEMFKVEQPAETVSYKKGLETIKGFQDRLGLQFPVFIYEKIYTGEMTAGSPQQAFGMYLDNTISLSQAITRFTADHEVGHFIFRNLENISAFNGITREQLLTELRAKYGNLSDVDLEEKLMEDLEVYAKQVEDNKPTTFKGKIKKFFEGVYQSITDLFGISKKQKTSIERFFDRMYFGKAKGITTFYNTGKTSAFMERRFKEFGEEPVMFKKAPVEPNDLKEKAKILDKQPSNKEVKEVYTENPELQFDAKGVYSLPENKDIIQAGRDFIESHMDETFNNKGLGIQFTINELTDEHLFGKERKSKEAYELKARLAPSALEIAQESQLLSSLDTSKKNYDFYEILGTDKKRFPRDIIAVTLSKEKIGDVILFSVRGIKSFPAQISDPGGAHVPSSQAGKPASNGLERLSIGQEQKSKREGTIESISNERQYVNTEEMSLFEIEQEYQEIISDEDFIEPATGEMPESLQMKQLSLELTKEAIDEDPLKVLIKHEAKSGEFKGGLPEEFGGDKIVKGRVVKSLRAGDEYSTDLGYDSLDDMREAYAKYKEQRQQYKTELVAYKAELKQFRESKSVGTFLEQQAQASDKRIKELEARMFVKNSLNILRSHIPRAEHAKFLTALSQVGTSETKYLKLVKAVMERKAELDIENDSRIDRARLRSDIGYLKKVYDIEPSLILNIKESLDIRDTYKTGERAGQPKEGLKSIKEYSMEELGLFMEELQTRIQFRKDNPVHYLSLAKIEEKKSVMKSIVSGVQKVDETVIATMERTVQKMSNSVYESMMTVFQQIAKSSQIYETKMKPLLSIYEKATPEDKDLIKLASQSSEKAKLELLLGQYATEEEVTTALTQAREVLDEIHGDLKDVGIEVPYRGVFFPRKLKNLTVEQAELAIKVFEHKMGRKATQDEKSVMLNNFMRGMDVSRLPFITLSGKRFETHRMIETLTEDLSPFYEDFTTALNAYVSSAIKTVELRRYFGKFQIDSLDYDSALNQSIGAKVYDLVEKGIVEQKDLAKLQDIMQTLFQHRVSDTEQKIQQFTSDIIYPLTLGQVASTINQLKDLSLQMLLNDVFAGQLNTLGSMKIKPEDVYLTDTLTNLETDTTTTKKLSKYILAPFGKADKTFLQIFINSASRRLVKLARVNNKKLQQQLTDVFGEEKGVVVMADLKSQDLKNINLSEEMKRLLFSEVAKTRPITKLQKTRTAVRHPMLYTLRNFMIKQIQFMRSQALDVISDGVKAKDPKKVSEGIARLAVMMAVIGFFGASVDELKDWLLGKTKDKSFWNRLTDNLLQTVGFNQYLISQGQKQGFATQFVYSYIPATLTVLSQVADNAVKDTQNIIDGDPIYEAKTFRKFPLVGELYYQRFGGGAN